MPENPQTIPEFRNSLNQIPVPVFVLTRDGLVRYANSAFLALSKPPREPFVSPGILERVLEGVVDHCEPSTLLIRVVDPEWGEVILGIVYKEEAIADTPGSGPLTPAQNELMANLSHELRSPLSSIAGLADLLLRGDLTPEQRESARLIKLSAESGVELLADLLDFAKSDLLEMSVRPVQCQFREFLDDVLRPFLAQAEAHGLRFTYDCHGVPDVITIDPLRVRQVLNNLVGNAIRFTRHGSVAVHIRLKDTPGGVPMLEFAVADTGIGIPREKQALIFERFVQAHDASSGIGGGAGLGLSIAARIIKMLKGQIWVTSEPGYGSTFYFTVPVAGGAEADAVDRETVLALTGGDDALFEEMARLFVEEYPRMTDAVRSAVAARDAARIERSAHALKGAIANFGARRAVDMALRLELKGREQDLAGIDELWASFESALGPLVAELKRVGGSASS